MKKHIPFISNSKDDLHCVPAIFRMLHMYYFGKDLSWEEMDKILKVVPGKGTWTFPGLTYFAKKGINILNIEPVDYVRLHKEELSYLSKVVGKNAVDYYINKSNLPSILEEIPKFLKIVKNEMRKSSIEEIINYLKQGTLVVTEINSHILNKKPGFNLHMVLLYDYDEKYIILHDPGLPPIRARKVTKQEFKKCFLYKGANGGITVFRKSKN